MRGLSHHRVETHPRGAGRETGGSESHAPAFTWKMAVPAEKKEAGPRMRLSRACGLPTRCLMKRRPTAIFSAVGRVSSPRTRGACEDNVLSCEKEGEVIDGYRLTFGSRQTARKGAFKGVQRAPTSRAC